MSRYMWNGVQCVGENQLDIKIYDEWKSTKVDAEAEHTDENQKVLGLWRGYWLETISELDGLDFILCFIAGIYSRETEKLSNLILLSILQIGWWVAHKGHPQEIPVFLPLPFVCIWLSPPPPCGRPHLALHTFLWSGSVIAGVSWIGNTQILREGLALPLRLILPVAQLPSALWGSVRVRLSIVKVGFLFGPLDPPLVIYRGN